MSHENTEQKATSPALKKEVDVMEYVTRGISPASFSESRASYIDSETEDNPIKLQKFKKDAKDHGSNISTFFGSDYDNITKAAPPYIYPIPASSLSSSPSKSAFIEDKKFESIDINKEWQKGYFARAKNCLETYVYGNKCREENFNRFMLYLGPPLFSYDFQYFEKILIKLLEKCRAEALHGLWDIVKEQIELIPMGQRKPHNIGGFYITFINSLNEAHKKWVKDYTNIFKAQVIESTKNRLLETGHNPDTVNQNFVLPLQRQYKKQLTELRKQFEKTDFMIDFLKDKNLEKLLEKVKEKTEKLEKDAQKIQTEYQQIKAEWSEKPETLDATNYYKNFEEWVFKDISSLSGSEEGVQEIVKWYGIDKDSLPLVKQLMVCNPNLLNQAERKELEALKLKLSKDFFAELSNFFKSQYVRQASVMDSEGNTLLHHALHRLQSIKTEEHRMSFLDFIKELYKHGSNAKNLNKLGQDVYSYSKIFQSNYTAYNKLLGWVLLNFHLRFTPVYSEVQIHTKQKLLTYSSAMPTFLKKGWFLQWVSDIHGLKRSGRFEDIWQAIMALNKAEEELNDGTVFDKIKERKEQDNSRAKKSSLFKSLDMVAFKVGTGELLTLHVTDEDRYMATQELVSKLEKQVEQSKHWGQEKEKQIQQLMSEWQVMQDKEREQYKKEREQEKIERKAEKLEWQQDRQKLLTIIDQYQKGVRSPDELLGSPENNADSNISELRSLVNSQAKMLLEQASKLAALEVVVRSERSSKENVVSDAESITPSTSFEIREAKETAENRSNNVSMPKLSNVETQTFFNASSMPTTSANNTDPLKKSDEQSHITKNMQPGGEVNLSS